VALRPARLPPPPGTAAAAALAALLPVTVIRKPVICTVSVAYQLV
jgi:hypothetical protein